MTGESAGSTATDFISGFFSLISQVNSSETQLSRYGKCEFYGIHKDNSIEIPQTRILTLVYYVNKEPAKFEGGDLIIYNEKLDENLRIKPKHNRAILFESKTKHAVDTVKLNGDFADGRFSVNCWLGFENLLRFR